jgi:hypothetical protein
VVADGHAFGKTGSYEKLVGRIEFAIDPNDRHNTRIADLAFAPRGTDGVVRFSSDLMVLQPTDRARANGILPRWCLHYHIAKPCGVIQDLPVIGDRPLHSALWSSDRTLKALLKRYFEAMVGFTQPFFITP